MNSFKIFDFKVYKKLNYKNCFISLTGKVSMGYFYTIYFILKAIIKQDLRNFNLNLRSPKISFKFNGIAYANYKVFNEKFVKVDKNFFFERAVQIQGVCSTTIIQILSFKEFTLKH